MGQKFFVPRSVRREMVTTSWQKVDGLQLCLRYSSTSDPGRGSAHSPSCPVEPESLCAGATSSYRREYTPCLS